MTPNSSLYLHEMADDSGNRIAYGRLTFNIVQLLQGSPEGMSTREIASVTQNDYNKINVTLQRLYNEGRIGRVKKSRALKAPNGDIRENRMVNFWFHKS